MMAYNMYTYLALYWFDAKTITRCYKEELLEVITSPLNIFYFLGPCTCKKRNLCS